MPDEWVSDWEKDHGRTERRRLARVDFDPHISLFPGARQLIRITREWRENPSENLKSETRYFITSLERDERSASRLGEAIRGHWSVENKNHWKRDTSQWKEDASRPRKKVSGGQVLALLRGAVLRLYDSEVFDTLNASFHHHSARAHAGLRLLKTPPPKIS
jgi:hypothetical protein